MASQYVHIHRPRSVFAREILYCKLCGRRRRHIVELFTFYDPNVVCCACGYNGRKVYRSRARLLQQKRRGEQAAQRWSEALQKKKAFEQLALLAFGRDA